MFYSMSAQRPSANSGQASAFSKQLGMGIKGQDEMVKIDGTWHVLAVNDVEKSMKYYVDTLGFKLNLMADDWRFLSMGAFRVMLGECPEEVPASETHNHSYFAYVNVTGIDELFSNIKSGGANFTQELSDKPWGMREFGVVTPDGHRIMFGQDIE